MPLAPAVQADSRSAQWAAAVRHLQKLPSLNNSTPPYRHLLARTSSVGCTMRPSARDSEKRPASRMGADIFAQIEKTYERPALRKPFAAFPADTKVA